MTTGDPAPTDTPRARRWYRQLLRLGPRALRARTASEMDELFLDALHDASARGRAATTRVWCLAAWDLARACFDATLQAPASHRRRHPRKA